MLSKKPLVFFNASVILAGLHSPSGGSAKVLNWSKTGEIKGCISELVLLEAIKHADKIKMNKILLEKEILDIINFITPAPLKLDQKFKKIVQDVGDIHLFTSAKDLKVDYLVSLDKKHVLSLKNKVKIFKVVSPGELIHLLQPEAK